MTIALHRLVIALGSIDTPKSVYIASALDAEHAVQRLGAYLLSLGYGQVENIRLNHVNPGQWNLNADLARDTEIVGGLHGTVTYATLAPIDTAGLYGEHHDPVTDLDADAYLDELLASGAIPRQGWAHPVAVAADPLTV